MIDGVVCVVCGLELAVYLVLKYMEYKNNQHRY